MITPELQPILQVIAMLLPVLNKWLVDLLQRAGVETDGRPLSRNAGVILVILFALTGMLTAPAITAPALGTNPAAVDLLVAFAKGVTELGALLAWVIAGSRVFNDAVSGDTAGPEPTPEPEPAPEPPTRASGRAR